MKCDISKNYVWLFFVSHVDGADVLTDAFVNAVRYLNTEDSLKALVKELLPECVTEGNSYV